jgi:hypothetical protein
MDENLIENQNNTKTQITNVDKTSNDNQLNSRDEKLHRIYCGLIREWLKKGLSFDNITDKLYFGF